MVLKNKVYIIAVALLSVSVTTLHAAQILFTPVITVSEEYNDNINLDSDNELDDSITTAGLSLTGQALWRTGGIELNYSPSYRWFADNNVYDSWRHTASLYTWKEIKQYTRLELRNTYLRSSDPADEAGDQNAGDPTQGPAIEIDRNRRGRSEYYTNNTTARINHQFGADDSFYLAYQYSILREEDTPSGAAVDDNDISTPSCGLIYNFLPKWGIQLNASYASTDYVDANDRDEFNGNIQLMHHFNRTVSGFIGYQHTFLDFDQEIDEDYKVYRPSIGMTMTFQENAGITLSAGYYIQDFETSEDQEGFNVDSTIYKRWQYRTGYFGVSGDSGYEIDDNGTQDNGLTIYYAGRIDAGYQFTSMLSSSIYCRGRYDDYLNITPDRVDVSTGAGVSLDWQALRWMAISLSYDYSNVRSDDQSIEYAQNSAMITIRISPASAYRLN